MARPKRISWKQNPEQVQRNILTVARQEFATNGLSGGRVDEIAARTETSKRMIYYYFGDKAGLYRAVLEDAYQEIRDGELQLDIEGLAPAEALRRLVEFTFDHHWENPDVIRLIMIENIHNGQYLAGSEIIKDLNKSALDRIKQIYTQGTSDGTFRRGLAPLQIHWQISALCFFSISNRATFSLIFGNKLTKPGARRALRNDVVEMVSRNLSARQLESAELGFKSSKQ